MTFHVDAFDSCGRKIARVGSFANVVSARQAMIDHASIIELPTEEPLHLPSLRLYEGWFIGRVEYHILTD